MNKKCFKCNLVKDLAGFYKHPQMKDGHLNKCIECTKNDVSEREIELKKDPNWIDKERLRGRLKYHKFKYKSNKNKKKNMELYYLKYPEKKDARNNISKIKRNIYGSHLHHWSYNKEHFKDVIELNPKDHAKAHRFIVYDQERKMYRRYDNNVLLDSKESHLEFIQFCIDNKED